MFVIQYAQVPLGILSFVEEVWSS